MTYTHKDISATVEGSAATLPETTLGAVMAGAIIGHALLELADAIRGPVDTRRVEFDTPAEALQDYFERGTR